MGLSFSDLQKIERGQMINPVTGRKGLTAAQTRSLVDYKRAKNYKPPTQKQVSSYNPTRHVAAPSGRSPSLSSYSSKSGSASKSAMGTGAASNRNLRLGMSGGDVRNLQSMLRNAGYNIKVDGQFGRATDNAVRQYQASVGLKVDGIAGNATKGKLMSGAGKSTRSGKTYKSPSSKGGPGGSPGGGPGGGGPGGVGAGIGGALDNLNFPKPTIPVYKPRGKGSLKNEVTTAANAIFNPLIRALADRQEQYEKAMRLGRSDIAAQYAQQIADLRVLAERTAEIINGNTESVEQAYASAKEAMTANTEQAIETTGAVGDELQNRMLGEIEALGLTGRVPTEDSGIQRDTAYTQALMQNVGQMGESGLAMGQGAAETALAMLASNAAAQSESLQGQARIAKDQAIRDVEREFLDRIMEGSIQLAEQKSSKQSWAYDAIRDLIDSEWAKYIESASLNFQQQAAGQEFELSKAGLFNDFLSASGAAGGGGGDNKAYLTDYRFADQWLQQQMAGLSDRDRAQVQKIWGLLSEPFKGGPYKYGQGEVRAGEYSGLRSGEPNDRLIPGYMIRMANSVKDRQWEDQAYIMNMLSDAIDYALNGGKSINLG